MCRNPSSSGRVLAAITGTPGIVDFPHKVRAGVDVFNPDDNEIRFQFDGFSDIINLVVGVPLRSEDLEVDFMLCRSVLAFPARNSSL